MKKRLTLTMLLFIALFANAQMVDPIQSSAQLKTNNSAEGEIIFSLKIDKGWHVFYQLRRKWSYRSHYSRKQDGWRREGGKTNGTRQ